MGISPFHAMLKARTIAGYIWDWSPQKNIAAAHPSGLGEEKLILAFASANIEIYPHQVVARCLRYALPGKKA